MGTVDNVTVVFLVERRLGAKLAAEELRGVSGRTAERPGNVGHVRNDGFDTIAFPFNLREKKGHAE